MSNFSEFDSLFSRIKGEEKEQFLRKKFKEHMGTISDIKNRDNVLLYYSAFMQKPDIPTEMSLEDINGIMNALYGMNYDKNLTIILHTPGGDIMAMEQITDYIHSKFKNVTVIVPVMSMSAGSMFALSCDNIIISRIGQLGPIDSQIVIQGQQYSVRDILQQFKKIKNDIIENPVMANIWAPVLSAYGPAVHEYSTKVEHHGKKIVHQWLKNKGKDPKQIKKILSYFYDDPNVHRQRIDRDALKKLDIQCELLEDDQKLQNAVMCIYHLSTLYVLQSSAKKIILNNNGILWTSNS